MNKQQILMAAMLTVSVLLGCGAQDDNVKQSEQQKFEEISWKEHTAAITERHALRWGEVIKVNFDGVYEYATPEYRRLYSKTHLHNQYAAQIKRKKARVLSIEKDPNNQHTAVVKTALTFATVLPNGELYEDEIALSERWRFSEGQWWFVEPK